MKNIPLKIVDMVLGEQTAKLNYKKQIASILENPPDRVSIDEMRRSIRVLDALEKVEDVLVLEDADFEHLKKVVLAAKWPMVNKVILTFTEDVTNPVP